MAHELHSLNEPTFIQNHIRHLIFQFTAGDGGSFGIPPVEPEGQRQIDRHQRNGNEKRQDHVDVFPVFDVALFEEDEQVQQRHQHQHCLAHHLGQNLLLRILCNHKMQQK